MAVYRAEIDISITVPPKYLVDGTDYDVALSEILESDVIGRCYRNSKILEIIEILKKSPIRFVNDLSGTATQNLTVKALVRKVFNGDRILMRRDMTESGSVVLRALSDPHIEFTPAISGNYNKLVIGRINVINYIDLRDGIKISIYDRANRFPTLTVYRVKSSEDDDDSMESVKDMFDYTKTQKEQGRTSQIRVKFGAALDPKFSAIKKQSMIFNGKQSWDKFYSAFKPETLVAYYRGEIVTIDDYDKNLPISEVPANVAMASVLQKMIAEESFYMDVAREISPQGEQNKDMAIEVKNYMNM